MASLGALAVMLGCLLPWASAGFISVTPPLFDSDAAVIFVVGLVTAILALVWLGSRAGLPRWVSLPLGVLALAVSIFEMVQLSSGGPMVTLGPGLFVCAVGAVAVIAGALVGP